MDARHPLMIAALCLAAGAGAADRLLGFTDEGAAKQRRLEAVFDSHLRAEDLGMWMRELAAGPHHAGSEQGRRNVETLARLFTSWGYDTEIPSYEVLLPTPRLRRLAMTAPHAFVASLEERRLEEDPSTRMEGVLPPFNAFSPDGDVSGELVYVNYGTREDYELLARYGVEVAGKIVIVRYGRVFRGVKPRLAAEHGAIGCIIYSDPADDGYVRGEVYPAGGYKNDSGVQRGSIMDLPLHAGDLLTPGWAAVGGARRLAVGDAPAMPTIPTLPISHADARPLLEAIGGSVAPEEWRGGLPITYQLGPGPAAVRLTVEFDWNTITARNVVARLEGSRWPDQWVLRGNHHDAWNHGAADPVSGLVALLAEAKAIAASGERPQRTLVYAAWDAEEYGLMGSTEWAEQHAGELADKAVLYTNTDGMSRGFVRIGGSPALSAFFDQIQRDVTDPRTGLSVGDRNRARIRSSGDQKAREELAASPYLVLPALGSGSDYTPFLQHLGISSANVSVGGEGQSGSYHTLYDTIAHYQRFGDPEHAYGVVLAKVAGRATLRMANAALLPFEFEALSAAVRRYLAEVEELASRMRSETERVNRLIDGGEFAAALDPARALSPPPKHAPVPHFNFAPLRNALDRLDRAAGALDLAPDLDEPRLEHVNRALYTGERMLIREAGLPGRPWYRHQIYAPGRYTGYGAKTLPWIREAVEQRRHGDVAAGVEAVAAAIDGLAAHLERAAPLAPGP